jgi:uncharacterized membrane protein HdeD (DUF308 family)
MVEGVVSIIAGVLALAFPAFAALSLLLIISAWSIVTGLVTIVWIMGAFAIVFGISMVVLGWRLRGIHQRASGASAA